MWESPYNYTAPIDLRQDSIWAYGVLNSMELKVDSSVSDSVTGLSGVASYNMHFHKEHEHIGRFYKTFNQAFWASEYPFANIHQPVPLTAPITGNAPLNTTLTITSEATITFGYQATLSGEMALPVDVAEGFFGASETISTSKSCQIGSSIGIEAPVPANYKGQYFGAPYGDVELYWVARYGPQGFIVDSTEGVLAHNKTPMLQFSVAPLGSPFPFPENY